MTNDIGSVTLEVVNKEVDVGDVDESEGTVVSGIALGLGDVTVGQSGNKKKWPADTLRDAASTLAGKPIVTDHDNDSRSVVGQVTKSAYKEDVGVIYEGYVFDEDLARKISQGLLEVSIRGYHGDPKDMEHTEDGAAIIDKLVFDNLSIVPDGASPSNTLDVGEHAELERNIRALFEADDVTNLSEEDVDTDEGYIPAEGDYVGWDREDDEKLTKFGQVIRNPDDSEKVEILPYDDSETVLVDISKLEPWHTANHAAGESDDDGSKEKQIDFEEVTTNFNESVDEDWMHTNPSALQTVFNRGMENATDEEDEKQNGMSRLNAFFFRLRDKDTFPDYTEDDDLLSEDHPSYNPDASGGRATGINRNIGKQMSNALPATMQEIYQSKVKAQKRAKEFGLSGYHELSVDGAVYYMPGEDHEEFMRELGKESGFLPENDNVTEQEEDADEDDDSWRTDDSLSLYEKMCRDAGIEEDILPTVEDLSADELYDEFQDSTNMTLEEMNEWQDHPCSTRVGIKPVTVQNRLKMLLGRTRDEWGDTEASSAKRVVSFVTRMEGKKPSDFESGQNGCPSDWATRMINWGHNPFDTLPDVPSKEEELALHIPEYNGLDAEGDWSAPTLDEFEEEYGVDTEGGWSGLTVENRIDIGDHYIYSASSFPAVEWEDLKFPVVHPDGTLSLAGLRSAKQSIGRSNLDDDEMSRLGEIVNEVAKREFDKNWGDADESSESLDIPSGDMKALQAEAHSLSRKAKPTIQQMKEVYRRGREVYDDAPDGQMENSRSEFALERVREYARLLDIGIPNDEAYTEDNDLLPNNHPRKEPMDTGELTQVQPAGFRSFGNGDSTDGAPNTSDSDMTDENEKIDDLESTVEELEGRNDDLLEEVESVRAEYAGALASESPFSKDELVEKFTVEELRDKYEEYDEAELASAGPSPEAGDASAAELGANDEDTEARIEELEAKAENYKSMGWTAALEDAEEEIEELRN